MREIRTSGSMSGEGKRGVAVWPKLPRLSSTLPRRAAMETGALFTLSLRLTLASPGAVGHQDTWRLV